MIVVLGCLGINTQTTTSEINLAGTDLGLARFMSVRITGLQ